MTDMTPVTRAARLTHTLDKSWEVHLPRDLSCVAGIDGLRNVLLEHSNFWHELDEHTSEFMADAILAGVEVVSLAASLESYPATTWFVLHATVRPTVPTVEYVE